MARPEFDEALKEVNLTKEDAAKTACIGTVRFKNRGSTLYLKVIFVTEAAFDILLTDLATKLIVKMMEAALEATELWLLGKMAEEAMLVESADKVVEVVESGATFKVLTFVRWMKTGTGIGAKAFRFVGGLAVQILLFMAMDALFNKLILVEY